jgi:polar amino acid transport system substrate-binding protein
MTHTRRISRLAVVVAVGLAAGILAGCAGRGGSGTAAGVPSFAAPRPAGIQDPAVIPGNTAGPPPTCDVRHSSLRPQVGNPAAGATLAKIKQRGRLIVGVDQNTYLFGYRDPATGQIVGFDIDIAREIAAALFGNPNAIQLTTLTSAQRIPAIQSGQVDLVARTMTITCGRLQQVDFSSDYFDAGQRVLVPRDSAAAGIGDLGGKKVCAAAGSTSISNIAAAPSHPIPVSVADWTDCMVLLQQGQVSAVSTDDAILLGMAAQDPNTKVVGDRFTDEPYGIAVDKNANDLLRFVNGVLERLRSDGTWARIYARWLPGPVPSPPPAGYRD